MKEMKIGESIILKNNTASIELNEEWINNLRLSFSNIILETKIECLDFDLPKFVIYQKGEHASRYFYYNAERYEIGFSQKCLSYPDRINDGLLRLAMTHLIVDCFCNKVSPRSPVDFMNLFSVFSKMFNVPKALRDRIMAKQRRKS